MSIEDAKLLQREVFKKQLDFAAELGLVVNVHSRSAGHHALDMVIQHPGFTSGRLRALFHAFDGKCKYAVAAPDGVYFSVPPSIARGKQMQKLVSLLPLQRLLLESDSPALAPVSGERNVPRNITVSAEWVSKIKAIPVETVVDCTTQLAASLFQPLPLKVDD